MLTVVKKKGLIPAIKEKVARRELLPVNNNPVRKINKSKVVFIHINKTGGTSVGKAIGLPRRRHFTIKEVSRIAGKKKLKEAFKFTVVRNPWDKVVSHYRYRIRTNQTDMAIRRPPFSEWVKKTYGTPKDEFYYDNPKMFQPQVEWLKDDKGEILVDEIIRFEHLQEDFQEVADQLNIDAELPALNTSKKTDFREFYDRETYEIVKEWFEEDIEYFDYSFR